MESGLIVRSEPQPVTLSREDAVLAVVMIRQLADVAWKHHTMIQGLNAELYDEAHELANRIVTKLGPRF